MRRRLLALAGAGLAVIALSSCSVSADELVAVSELAAFREANGLPVLTWHEPLQAKAHAHAAAMQQAGGLYHSDLYAGAPPGWSLLGENVVVGGSAEQCQDLLEGSAGHRARMLDSRWTHVGVGVAVGADGRAWCVQEFARI